MIRKLYYILVLLLMVAQGAGAQSTSDIGKVLAADGKMYKTVAAATNAGTTASGIIAYWGVAGSVESGNSSYRGMAIALQDAVLTWGDRPNHMEYCTSASHQCSTATPYCSTVSEALNAKNGIAATQSAIANNGEGHWHNAAGNGDGVALPSGASGWAIPSVGQWKLMAQGLTGKSSDLSDTDNPDYTYDKLSAKITAAGGNTLIWLLYWSSTETDASKAWTFDLGGINSDRNGSRFNAIAKNHNNQYMHVRMFFAFSSATAAVYTISYNANGGSGAPSAQTKDGGIDLTLSSTMPTRSGFAFTGWNTKADGSGTSYTSGATFTGNANTTLYAQWTFQGSGSSTDPYLIPSADVWNFLADKVNNGTNYAEKYFRLTNNISVTTMVGDSESNSFCGTFDGDGHTLNISYNNTSEDASDYTAPFRYIQGATFKNLKVTGSITTTMNYAAGIAGLNTNAVATFDQCVTDVTINSSSTTGTDWGNYDYHGGLLARTNSANVTITDCACGGRVEGSSSDKSSCAGFVGVAVSCTVSAKRCLSTTSYTKVKSWNPLCHVAGATRDPSVFYFVNGNDLISNAEQVTTSQLAGETYATNLQTGHATKVWVIDPNTNQPRLLLFVEKTATLSQTENNAPIISTNNGVMYDITLTRTLQAGGWNTFCVPFSTDIPSGWTVKQLTETSYANGVLTLTFGDASTIAAGTPYLVKVDEAVPNPTFCNVTIVDGTTEVTPTGGYVTFVPVMNPTSLTGGDKTVLFVKDGQKLTYPSGNGNINGFRAYFRLLGDAAANARSFAMSFDDEAMSIVNVNDDENENCYYDLQGRKVNNPTKGIYIVNAKKVVMK